VFEKLIERIECLKGGKREFDAAVIELRTAAFKELCKKKYLESCEPEYCSYRIRDDCPFLNFMDDAGLKLREKGIAVDLYFEGREKEE
jgi:hypothetical protein